MIKYYIEINNKFEEHFMITKKICSMGLLSNNTETTYAIFTVKMKSSDIQ